MKRKIFLKISALCVTVLLTVGIGNLWAQDSTLSNLPAVTTPASTDLFLVTQGAISKKETRVQVHTLESGELFLIDIGSVSAPGLALKIDIDTGVYSPGVDRIAIVAGGVEGVRVTEAAGVITVLNDGFTKLGDSAAPSIKQKKLTGTTGATEGTTTNIAHGLTIGKILGYHVLVSTGSGNRVPPVFASVAEHEYDAFMDGTNVVVALTATNSGSILSRAISVLVTYEE